MNLSGWVQGLNLRTKLFTTILIAALFPLLAGVPVLYAYLSGSLREQTEFAARTTLQQAKDYLAYTASEAAALSDTLLFTPSVREILSRPLQQSEADVVQQVKDANEMSQLFSSMTSGRQVSGVRLYVQPTLLYANENRHFFNYDTIRDSWWHRELFKARGSISWFSPEELGDGLGQVAACRPIANYAKFDECIGVLRIDVDQDTLAAIVDQARSTPHAAALLVNPRGRLLTPAALEPPERDALTAWALRQARPGETLWQYQEIASQKRLLGVTDIPSTDWVLLCSIPISDILAPSHALIGPMAVLSLLYCLLTILMSLFVSRNNTRRVEQLLADMAMLENGEFLSPGPDTQQKDEIGILTYQFHRMRERLYLSLRERTEALERLRLSEIRALQAQINPHFLYNTLDFIHWEALEYGADQLADIVLALSRFYRLSLSGGRDLVPLAQEIEHAKTYLHILNVRFERKIRLEVDGCPEAMDVRLPRITLQPLVENAVYHGILPALGDGSIEEGVIQITAQTLPEGYRICVRDNGAGMDEKKRLRLFADPPPSGGGYGLGNIAHRLRILFPGAGTLEVRSSPGAGTAVTFVVPR